MRTLSLSGGMFFLAAVKSTSRRLGVGRGGVSAFAVISSNNPAATAKSTTRLGANFFDNLQRSFSSENAMSGSKYYTIGITGSGGLVGTALRDELSRRQQQNGVNGKPVRIVRLQRGSAVKGNEEEELPDDATTETTVTWNPNGQGAEDILALGVAEQLDAVVHLSGENVATGLGPLGFLGIRPWTQAKKDEIINSRVTPTQAISQVLAATKRPQTLLTASGVGVYGYKFMEGGLDAVDESADVSSTQGFLAEVSRVWEAATAKATAKNRVVNMRFGVVLSKNGGALAKLYPIFFSGGGGNVGSGKQYFTFISARDIARAIIHTLETPTLKGPVNLSAPQPCTNAEFTKALGNAIGRPTILPFPGFAVSLLFGEMGEEMLLGGVRCVPTKLLQSGFEFQHPTIDAAIKSALEENI